MIVARLQAALGRIIGLSLLGFVTACCVQPEPPPPPNVLVLLVDALRADRLGVHGYPRETTPAIDRLAAEGTTFRTALAHATWTKPSIATLFTSLYPWQHGLDRVAVERGEGLATDVLEDRLVTLAERFQAAGYATCAVINQVHLKARFGFAQGFDHFEGLRSVGAKGINGRFQNWLDGETRRPFFAYLHYLDAHWPYTKRPKDRADAFGPTEMTVRPPTSGHEVSAWTARLTRPADLAALESRYDREVAFVDEAIGRLMAVLRERGLYEETLVVVTSDHGEGFLEHGELQHGYPPYDEVVRVPLVLRLPAKLRGEVGEIGTPVGLVDLLPTLLDLAGLDPEPQAQGVSLAPALRGEPLPRRVLFAETDHALGARSEQHKLIRFHDGRELFFDLAADPGEQAPVAGPCDGPCATLARRLARYRHLMATAPRARPGQAEVTPEEIEDLKRLGYL